MKRAKKIVRLACSMLLIAGMLGCGSNGGTNSDTESAGNKAVSGEISVVSREDGSGTRSAFVELTGVQEKDADGNKIDNTTG